MEISKHETQWLKEQGARMVEALGVKESHSVIDFGSGKGRYTIPISQAIGEKGLVTSVERNQEELDILNKRLIDFGGQGTINILNTEDIELPLVQDKTIDHIFTFDVLQYIDDWKAFFSSMLRVLKPGGKIHVYPATIPHPGAVDMESVTSLLEELGLQVRSKREFKMMHNKDMVDDEVYTFG